MACAQATPSSGIAATLDMEQIRCRHRFTRTVISKIISKLDVLLQDPAPPAVELHVLLALLIHKEIELWALDTAVRTIPAADALDDD